MVFVISSQFLSILVTSFSTESEKLIYFSVGIYLGIPYFELHMLYAAPLYFPIKRQWSLT